MTSAIMESKRSISTSALKQPADPAALRMDDTVIGPGARTAGRFETAERRSPGWEPIRRSQPQSGMRGETLMSARMAASLRDTVAGDAWRELSYELIGRYLDVLAVEHHVGAATRKEHRMDLLSLHRWLGRHSKRSLVSATDAILVRYLGEELARSRTAAVRRRRTMRRFYAWLRAVGCREDDPMHGRRMGRWWATRAKTFMPLRRARRLGPALTSRDRTIFALMLACGLDARDIAALKLHDLMLKEGVLLSGNRRVELRPVLSKLLQEYLDNARPRLLVVRNCEYVFPSPAGGPLCPAVLRDAVAVLSGKFLRSLGQGMRCALH